MSAPVVSSAAEIETKPTLQRHLGRSPEPRLGTGPVSVAAAQAIMPLLMGTVAGGAIHPNIGKVGGHALKPFMSFLRWFIEQENKGIKDLDKPRCQYMAQRPRRGEPYSDRDPRLALQATRSRLKKILEQSIEKPLDLQIAKTMLTSNRNAMNKEMLADFDKSGQSHLQNVSVHYDLSVANCATFSSHFGVLGKLKDASTDEKRPVLRIAARTCGGIHFISPCTPTFSPRSGLLSCSHFSIEIAHARTRKSVKS